MTKVLHRKGKHKLEAEVFGNAPLVVIDCAKREHAVQVLNAETGEMLLAKALRISNDEPGMNLLEKKLNQLSRKHKLDAERTLFVFEDCASYAENLAGFINSRRQWRCARVNAFQASEMRRNQRTSSDELDLDGIAQAALSMRVYLQTNVPLYKELRNACRHRTSLVKQRKSALMHMHEICDRIFPGFIGKDKPLHEIGNPALFLFEHDAFSAADYRCRSCKQLSRMMEKSGVRQPETAAKAYKKLAQNVLGPLRPQELHQWKERMKRQVQLLRSIQACIEEEEKVMATLLAQTPGAGLTSIVGFGIVHAASIMAELGPPEFWGSEAQIASYAGLIPQSKQSGGSDNPARVGHKPKKINHHLKNTLMSAAKSSGRNEHPFSKRHLPQWQHPLRQTMLLKQTLKEKPIAHVARKLVRVVRAIVLKNGIYTPRRNDPYFCKEKNHELYNQWIHCCVEKMLMKWQSPLFAQALALPEEYSYLRQITRGMGQVISIDLEKLYLPSLS